MLQIITANWRNLLLVYTGAVLCGAIGSWVNLPLPWMIGALLFSMTLKLSGNKATTLPLSRPIGQMGVAASVGLAFTPEAVAVVAQLLGAMVATALLTVLAGFLVAAVLMRLSNLDVISASLASVPIGPVETARLAERHGVAPGPVVFAQTLRIVLLVICVPPALVALDGSVQDPSLVLRSTEWTASGALLLGASALGGAVLARALRMSNAFFTGALAGSAAAAALSLPISALPYPVLVIAQLFLGTWLGAVFDRDLIRRAGSFVPAALVSTVLLMVLCALLGLGLAVVTGEPWPVMILATAPGSVTEMALTAKILEEGIATVTAFHLVRILIIMPGAPLIFWVTAQLARRYGLEPGSGTGGKPGE